MKRIVIALLIIIAAAIVYISSHTDLLRFQTIDIPAPVEHPSVSSDTPSLAVGKSALYGNLRIRLVDIMSDSRCPAEVQCIQAGSLVARVELVDATHTATMDIQTGKTYTFGPYNITIADVLPQASVSRNDTGEYSVTFSIIRSSETASVATKSFTGTITSYSTGCFVDGVCSITVGDNIVIITQGFRADRTVGKLIGVESIGDLEGKIGSMAEVYAGIEGPHEYTLYGNTNFYVKVL